MNLLLRGLAGGLVAAGIVAVLTPFVHQPGPVTLAALLGSLVIMRLLRKRS